MNKSLRTELAREIRASLPRFLSILIMVALGVMFLVGLRSAAPDMRATADSYFDGQGTGLTVARNIARRMGGDIILDADYAGPGARFVLSLPL